MVGWFGDTVANPRVRRRLLREEGEVVVDEVLHHWVVYIRPALEGLVALFLLGVGLFSRVDIAWLPWLVALGVGAHAGYRALYERMDRFVITNMRVFRVRGVFGQNIATMPLGRILDITVDKPFPGRVLGYGHFVFESAAQEQGLRDIRYIGRPDERDLTIQRVVQKAGLRAGPRRTG